VKVDKLTVDDFTRDLDQLVSTRPDGYSIEAAAEIARRAIRAAG
jgi:hypothetical protein